MKQQKEKRKWGGWGEECVRKKKFPPPIYQPRVQWLEAYELTNNRQINRREDSLFTKEASDELAP